MKWPFKKDKTTQPIRNRSEAWPKFVNGNETIACWTNQTKDERVLLIRRSDNLFQIESEYFSDDEYENCWFPNGSSSIFDSEETAVREIESIYPWITEVEKQKKP